MWITGLIDRLKATRRKVADIWVVHDPHYDLVGKITVAWAFIDYSLDVINTMIFLMAGGNAIQSEIPVSLNNKIAFFRKAYQNLDGLAPFKNAGLGLIAEVAKQREARHDFVHGIVINKVVPAGRTLRRYLHVKDHISWREITYSMEEGRAISQKAWSLAADLALHASTLGVALQIRTDGEDGDG